MNLYNLHSNPKELYGFDVAPYKMPELAYELANTNPELRPKLEPAIMKDPKYAYYYVRDVLKRPWPEAEPVIIKDPTVAADYASDVLKRRWPDAEPYIMKDPQWAYSYVRSVLKRAWPEAEPYIMKDPIWWNQYKKMFKNGAF